MFKYTIVLHSIDDVQHYLNNIDELLSKSNLNPITSKFLKDQIVTTLKQAESHMDEAYTGTFNVNRILEGDGYMVRIKGRKQKPGILSRLFNKS